MLHRIRLRIAFTLVELLVVIAIIGVLVALLLPGVQAAREAARRNECANHHKQVALALHNFYTAHGHFPHGQYNLIDDFGASTPAPYNGYNERRCWMHDILPFLEQLSLYEVIDNYVRSQPNSIVLDQVNMCSAPQRWQIVPELMCPSDPTSPKVLTCHFGGPGPAMTPEGSQGFSGNIVACAGDDYFNPNGPASSRSLDGMFFPLSKVRLRDVADGSSKTLLVSEIILVPDTLVENDLRGRYYNSRHGTALFSSRLPPNTAVPDNLFYCRNIPNYPLSNWTQTNVFLLARSYHPGGVNAAFADGSVRFIPDEMDPIAYKGLGTRSGNELVMDQ